MVVRHKAGTTIAAAQALQREGSDDSSDGDDQDEDGRDYVESGGGRNRRSWYKARISKPNWGKTSSGTPLKKSERLTTYSLRCPGGRI